MTFIPVFPQPPRPKWDTDPSARSKWSFGGHTPKVIAEVSAPGLKWDMGRPRLVRRRFTT